MTIRVTIEVTIEVTIATLAKTAGDHSDHSSFSEVLHGWAELGDSGL